MLTTIAPKLKVSTMDQEDLKAIEQLLEKKLQPINEKLDSHTQILESQTHMLESHTEKLDSHTASLMNLEQKVDVALELRQDVAELKANLKSSRDFTN